MIGLWFLMTSITFTVGDVSHLTSTSKTTSPLQSSILSINPKLRKALLEALTNYHAEDSTESDDETTTLSDLANFEENVTNNPSVVKIHTFAVDGDKSDENEVIKTIIITRPKTTLTPPRVTSNAIDDDQVQIKFTTQKTPDPVNDDADETESVQLVRSVDNKNSSNPEKKEEKTKKKSFEKAVTKALKTTIASTVTTTTLPPPVTNADGDNIEKVAKEDVKIFQAPLLAAFTVQQDGSGQPNKVISLINNSQQNNDKRVTNQEFRASQPLPTAAPLIATQSSNTDLVTAFEQKQRQLEDQIRFLQARQREQDEVIKHHQLLQEQHNRVKIVDQQRIRFEEDQRQRQRLEEEQRLRQREQQEQQFQLRQQQIQALKQPQTQALIAPPSPNFNVQFIPSIPLGHTVGISVEQQLPFKGPQEFNPDKPDLQKSFQQLQQQFQQRQFLQQQHQRNAGFNQPSAQPLIQQHEVQQIATQTQLPRALELPVRNAQNFVQFTPLSTTLEIPQKPFQTFNSAPLSILPSITEIAPHGPSRNRVFRQDASQTGNFGFNDQRNYQIQQQQLVPFQNSFDVQLQNLFQQSGISNVNTRSAEDFRIISKVLALNHGVPNDLLFTNQGRFK